MKYIYYILTIWVIASLGLIITFYDSPTSAEDVALRINDRTFSAQDLQDEYTSRPYNVQTQEELIDRIITRELLIQEALRQKIDLDESFRHSMKSYYEQSLTKTLLEQQTAAQAVPADNATVQRFIELMDKKINFSLFDQDDSRAEKKLSGPFVGFSSDIQMTIIAVPRGELTPVITVQGKTYRLRLDMITNNDNGAPEIISTTQAAALINEYNRKQALQDWLYELRKHANIKVNIKALEQESNNGQL